jgi:tetratricopeptide (TPR) repeat protein
LLSVVRGLLEVAPHHTRASRALSSPELAGLLTRIGIIPAGEHISAPRSEPEFERTMRQHKAVAELVLEVARARSLMIAIDDAHLVHPVAAGVLTVLAVQFQRGSLLLACSVHSEQVAPPAVQQLALMGTDMTLEPLTQAAVELLVKSMFGAAPHRARLAQWLTTHAQGNPGKLLDLLRELVARRVLHYAGGSWALPSELDDTLLLQDSRELVGTRLARLSVQARDLAALLALQNGSLSEALCSELVPEHGARAALDELVREQLCVSDRAGYRLAQDGVRTLLLERLSEEHKRGMHQTLGTVLRRMNESVIKALQRARSTDLSTEQIVVGVAAGLHLLLGNETALGTRLLRNAAIALTLRGDGLTAAAADLEQGIATLRARGASRYVYVTLMAPLALAGNYADWRLSYRHGDETMATLAEVSGLSLARKLTPFVGGRVALFAGLALAFVQFMLLPQRRITNSFHEIFLGLLGVGSAVIGVCTALQHQARAREVGEKLAPLRHFPARHPLRMVHEFQRALLDYATGHYAEAHAKANAALVFVRSPEATAMIAESGRAQLEAGILIVLGQFDSLRCDGSALRTMAAAGELDTATAQQTLASTRVAYHGHRGERDALVRALEDMDQLAVKSGSIWRNDVGMPRMLWSTLTVCEDVLSLKRAVQQLDSLGGATSIVAQMRDTLHACYLSERGMAAEALARYEAMFQGFANETGLRAAQHAMVYARILRKAGLPERAEQICVRALAKLSRAEHEFTVVTVCLRRELAQALAALGQLQQATELVDVLLQEQTGHDNPLLHSLGHGSRAELALLQGDWTRFDTEIDAMRKWLQQCQHPALYAQCQRLVARAQRGGGAAPLPAGSLPQPETELLP